MDQLNLVIHAFRKCMDINLGSRILLTLALLVPGLARGEETRPYFDIIRNGSTPLLSLAQFDSARATLRTEIGHLRAEVIRQALPLIHVESCRRYSAATQNVLSQLQSNLSDLDSNASTDTLDDNQFLLRERFELLYLAYQNLYNMFSRGEEGGNGIDPSIHVQCAFADRAVLGEQLHATADKLFVFYRDGFGTPGLLTLDHASDRLLKIAKDVTFRRDMYSWALVLSSLVFMPSVWKAAPVLIEATFTRVMTRVPSILLRRDVARGLGLLGVSGEGVTFNYLNDLIVPVEDERHTDFIIGWRDRIKEIEALVQAPLDYAELDYAYLGSQKNILADNYQKWLQDNAADLVKTYGNRYTETLALVHEFQMLNNVPIEMQIERTKKILLAVYGYQVRCETGLWNSVADVPCLASLRRFARAAYAGDLPFLTLSTQEALTFLLTSKSGSFDNQGEPMVLSLNAQSEPFQVRQEVQSALNSSALRTRIFDNQQFANLLHDFELNTGLNVTVDGALNHLQRWRSLMMLTEMAKADPLIMNLGADEIHLGPDFRDFAEHGIKMRLTISAEARAEQVRRYLRAQEAQPNRMDILKNFDRRRQDLRVLVDQLKTFKLEANCSEVGELTLDGCVYGLVQIARALKRAPIVLPPTLKTVIILNKDDLPMESTVIQSGKAKVWAVRNDVTPAALAGFLKTQGWLRE